MAAGISSSRVPFYMLFSFGDRKDFVLMLLGTVGALGNGATFPLMTILLGSTVNSFGSNSDTKLLLREVAQLALKFTYLAVGAGVASFLQVTCWMVTGERQSARIRSLYLKTVLRQEISFFDNEINTGEVIERMSSDTFLIQDAIGEKVGKFIQLAATFCGGFIIAFIKGWLLTLVLLSAVPLIAFSNSVSGIVIGRQVSYRQLAYSEAASVVDQTIGSIRTVASFTGERKAITMYSRALQNAYKAGAKEGLASGLSTGINKAVLFCSYSLAIWYGGKMISTKEYTGGDIVNVIFATFTGASSLGYTSPCLYAFAAGQAAAFKMFEAIKRIPDIDAYDPKGTKMIDIRGDIELRDVCFAYPSRPDDQIFNGFSLSVSNGETVALVGQSGSGKSTVISLIERFYDPVAGEVLIDGINLKHFQLKWIRAKIGLVSQEPVLFTSSIRDNITYGKDDPTDEEIRAAVELANAAKLVDSLPQGLNTLVGQKGIQLSGGQKQRVAIARAILKDPRILLLDEATSALDAESERIVQEALDRIMLNRTTVVVAHRLSTVKNADMIAVLEQGKIVEKGSHSELQNDPNGAYSQLISLQQFNKDFHQNVDSQNSGKHSAERISSPQFENMGSARNGTGGHFSINLSDQALKYTNPDARRKPQLSNSILRLAPYQKPEIPMLLLGLASAVAYGLSVPIMAVLLSSAIKVFYEPKLELQRDSEFYALMFLVLAIGTGLTLPAMCYYLETTGHKMVNRIRLQCFEKIIHMEISWFDKQENSSGALGARLSTDAVCLKKMMGDALCIILQNVTTGIAGLMIAFVANWRLALIILLVMPLIGVNGYVQAKFIMGFSADAKKKYEEASQVASSALRSIRTVASFCAEEKVMKLYLQKCDTPLKLGIRQGLVSGTGFGLASLFIFATYAASFYAGARLVDAGKATFAEVFRVFFALTLTAIGISQAIGYSADLGKAQASAISVLDIIDQTPKIGPSDNFGKTLDNVKGEIEFCHVGFNYPSRPSVQIFQDLNLKIHAGQTVALVGESGSGKSTVISLLQRFYDPDSGYITLDGVEIHKLQLGWLRQQMGLVSQEPVLFNDSIRANIAYAKEGNATESEIIGAAELANAHNFISGLQQGYSAKVGECGVQLSGGQKQRVAIARAIMKCPKILLLDEATSALDAESERLVQEALERAMVGRTTIVVAHRLSTIRAADLIVVLKNGKMAEQGKHESLICIKDGIYASLVALQSSASC
ncbi:unnamed protein product [Rhodiola kirilowii]